MARTKNVDGRTDGRTDVLFKLVRGPFPLFYNKRKGPLYTIEQGATRNETKDSFVLGFTKWPSNQFKLLGRTHGRTHGRNRANL